MRESFDKDLGKQQGCSSTRFSMSLKRDRTAEWPSLNKDLFTLSKFVAVNQNKDCTSPKTENCCRNMRQSDMVELRDDRVVAALEWRWEYLTDLWMLLNGDRNI